MIQSASHLSLHNSRLIHVLMELAVSDADISHKHFAEKLSQQIDIADSIRLSTLHGERSRQTATAGLNTAGSIQTEFLTVRSDWVQAIVKSFRPDADPRGNVLPRPKAENALEISTSFEPYLRFYAAHQRDMDAKIPSMQNRVRVALASVSPDMAQLVALDQVMAETLQSHARKCLNLVPRLIQRRFAFLLAEHESQRAERGEPEDASRWMQSGGWLALFSRELQSILLAELDVRLLPTLGLLEALEASPDKPPKVADSRIKEAE